MLRPGTLPHAQLALANPREVLGRRRHGPGVVAHYPTRFPCSAAGGNPDRAQQPGEFHLRRIDDGMFQYGLKTTERISSTNTGVWVFRARPTMTPMSKDGSPSWESRPRPTGGTSEC